ncbi:hypothetical protein AWZ03_003108 [Drosophila navojoa]|uniref:Uncharacterized protein n=1 Tax=Drosophila navojoa TaxID=7232 RepID=A0A484BNX0_DRONA|nr:hypothetical protein AWZ03_003108 [Drosophila navojoa]
MAELDNNAIVVKFCGANCSCPDICIISLANGHGYSVKQCMKLLCYLQVRHCPRLTTQCQPIRHPMAGASSSSSFSFSFSFSLDFGSPALVSVAVK